MTFDPTLRTLWHSRPIGGGWTAEPVIEIEPIEAKGWPFPVPALITDQVISLDNRYLYCSSWLHGDLRQDWLDPHFYFDFGKARSHEIRLPNGDPTTEIGS